MTQKLISMTAKELSRYDIVKNLIDRKINGTDAAKQIGVSVRHIKRLKARAVKLGAAGLIHKSRGRESNRKLNDRVIALAKKHLEETYYDFGPTFAAEKLLENHQIKINKETVRLIMADLGLWKSRPRKQPKERHSWRPRKDNYGELEQFDGSYHKWFGQEETCLLLSADDATGKITHGQFDYSEGVKAVFDFWWGYFEKNGLPLSIYLDKFSTYKVNHKNAVDNHDLITQFERAMKQSGVKLITAHSPEAKGRIERMFKTLQDRLVKEFRLADIDTMEKANEFLKNYIPKFNAKFAVIPPRKKDLHQRLSVSIKEKLPQIFSIQSERKINNDYTIRFKNKYYQLDKLQPVTVYKKDAVIMEELLNGVVKINLKERYLNYWVLPEKPKKEINIKLSALTAREPNGWRPPADHPWRKYSLTVKKRINAEQLIANFNQ